MVIRSLDVTGHRARGSKCFGIAGAEALEAKLVTDEDADLELLRCLRASLSRVDFASLPEDLDNFGPLTIAWPVGQVECVLASLRCVPLLGAAGSAKLR